uniref:DS cell adhesion molecule like 1 n=1 Tax=Podarcis muralis TaxID=64176 RepID=A0A670K923_PODMU
MTSMMSHTSVTSMPMGRCSSTLSRHLPSIALSTTTTISVLQRILRGKSGAQISGLKQFSGNLTQSGWRIKGQCVETWLFSSASSLLRCKNTSVLCPGRKTRFLSSQVRVEALLLLTPWSCCFLSHDICCHFLSSDPWARGTMDAG